MKMPKLYSIEKHGDEFALYKGRNINEHGFRLCNIHDFDMNGATTIGLLRSAFKALEELSRLKSAVDHGVESIPYSVIDNVYEEVMKEYRNRGDY